jgi:hypothetical protein
MQGHLSLRACRPSWLRSDGLGNREVGDVTMEKEPADMTLGELWYLFPIFLVPHDERQGEY